LPVPPLLTPQTPEQTFRSGAAEHMQSEKQSLHALQSGGTEQPRVPVPPLPPNASDSSPPDAEQPRAHMSSKPPRVTVPPLRVIIARVLRFESARLEASNKGLRSARGAFLPPDAIFAYSPRQAGFCAANQL